MLSGRSIAVTGLAAILGMVGGAQAGRWAEISRLAGSMGGVLLS